MVPLFAPFVVSSVFLPMGRDSPKPKTTRECLELARQRVGRDTTIQVDSVALSNICIYEPILLGNPWNGAWATFNLMQMQNPSRSAKSLIINAFIRLSPSETPKLLDLSFVIYSSISG